MECIDLLWHKANRLCWPFLAAAEMHVAFGTKALATRVLALSMRDSFHSRAPTDELRGRRDGYRFTQQTGG